MYIKIDGNLEIIGPYIYKPNEPPITFYAPDIDTQTFEKIKLSSSKKNEDEDNEDSRQKQQHNDEKTDD